MKIIVENAGFVMLQNILLNLNCQLIKKEIDQHINILVTSVLINLKKKEMNLEKNMDHLLIHAPAVENTPRLN